MPPPITTAWARSATEADYREWRRPKLGKNPGNENRVNRGDDWHGRGGPGGDRRRPRAAFLPRLRRPDATAVTRRRDQAGRRRPRARGAPPRRRAAGRAAHLRPLSPRAPRAG